MIKIKQGLFSGVSAGGILLAAALTAQTVQAGPLGLPNGTSCDIGDPICIKDAAKWTIQDSKDLIGDLGAMAKELVGKQKDALEGAIGKIKNKDFLGAAKDLADAQIKFPAGALGRANQKIIETAEKIVHDRSASTKGYTDRKLGDGVRAANDYTASRIGDLGKVTVGEGENAGNAKWRTNISGQIIDGKGSVIRPHLGSDSKIGALDGYYTVDSNTGGLVMHNATGGIVYNPGEISGNALETIGGIMSGSGKDAKAVGEWLSENGMKWDNSIGKLVDSNGKIIANIGEFNEKIGNKGQDIGKWLQGKTEQQVTEAGGKTGQERDKTVKEYADEGNAKTLKSANAYADSRIGDLGDIVVETADENKDSAAIAGLKTRKKTVKEYVDAASMADRGYTDHVAAQVLQQANDYTNMRFDQLNGKIRSARKEARQAAAIGIASASLRFDDTPGKLSFAMGGGAWHGQGAGAFGAGYTHPNGKLRFNVNGAFTSNNIGGGGGITYTFN